MMGGPREAAAGTLVAVALAAATLLGFSRLAVRDLAWSDELSYAVMGRNIADGRGLVSGYYAAPAILERGHPLGDVHPPGFALVLAAAFLTFGATPEAALAPGALSLVLSAVALFWLGRSIAGAAAGGVAALLLVCLPGVASYAHTAMPELPILLVSVAILGIWWHGFERPTLGLSAGLALAILLGMLLRETLLVFVLPAAWWLTRGWLAGCRRPAGVFAVVFGALLFGVALPLLANRAPFPHFVSDVLALEGLGARVGALLGRASGNLRGLVEFSGDARHWAFLWMLGLCVLLPLASLSRSELESRLARYALLCTLPTLGILVWVYPLHTGAGLRAMMFLAPPALLLLSIRLLALSGHRLPATGLVAAASLLVSIAAAEAFRQDRIAFMRYDRPFSQLVERATATLAPRAVIAENAFAFGWLAYPVDVIWMASARPAEVAALERRLQVDAIFVGERRRDELLAAVAAGELTGGYSVASEPAPGVFLLVRASDDR